LLYLSEVSVSGIVVDAQPSVLPYFAFHPGAPGLPDAVVHARYIAVLPAVVTSGWVIVGDPERVLIGAVEVLHSEEFRHCQIWSVSLLSPSPETHELKLVNVSVTPVASGLLGAISQVLTSLAI
jgi:hypothetical protein